MNFKIAMKAKFRKCALVAVIVKSLDRNLDIDIAGVVELPDLSVDVVLAATSSDEENDSTEPDSAGETTNRRKTSRRYVYFSSVFRASSLTSSATNHQLTSLIVMHMIFQWLLNNMVCVNFERFVNSYRLTENDATASLQQVEFQKLFVAQTWHYQGVSFDCYLSTGFC